MSVSSSAPVRGAIVAMNRENIIGIDGNLPWHYSEDLKRFKRVTMGSIIVMGRLTWESIDCKPLPGRQNIVISRSEVNNIEHYNNLKKVYDTYPEEDIWVIGGGQIYLAAFDWLTLLDVTYVPDKINRNDAIRFPVISSDVWQEVKSEQLENSPLINVIYHKK